MVCLHHDAIGTGKVVGQPSGFSIETFGIQSEDLLAPTDQLSTNEWKPAEDGDGNTSQPF